MSEKPKTNPKPATTQDEGGTLPDDPKKPKGK